MKILSHRGYWKEAGEKNRMPAFTRSFALGFGTETDFRDLSGSLVISHDPPVPGAIPVDDCLSELAKHDPGLTLAINIKSDGLQTLLKDALLRHAITDYFLFDMSVPDAIQSLKAGLRIFTRHSDVEWVPALYEQSSGVWLDAFHDHEWITAGVILRHLDAGKEVCLVSPELHRRDRTAFWESIRNNRLHRREGLMLCTDVPEEAKVFFDHE